MRRQTYLDFKDTLKGEKQYYRQGWERIEKYYRTADEDQRATDMKTPPHGHIMGSAKSFVELAISDSTGMEKMTDTDDVLLGVGAELLIKGIILKEDPEWFTGKVRTNGDCVYTPSFWDCQRKVMSILKDELTREQLERLEDVLTLINLRRNELVHLHFHQVGHYAIPYQILNAMEFLFGRFFPEEEEFTARLSLLKEKRRVGPGGTMDFKMVEFSGGEV